VSVVAPPAREGDGMTVIACDMAKTIAFAIRIANRALNREQIRVLIHAAGIEGAEATRLSEALDDYLRANEW